MKISENIKKTSDLNETVFNLLEATQTNWLIEKRPLFATNDDGANINTESFGVFRADTKDWLGTVKGQYTPMQNKDLAQTLVESSFEIGDNFRGGTLQSDRKVFYQIQISDYTVANDTLKRYVTAINSHDGSTSIAFGSTNTVVVCQNTFYKAYKGIEKFRHTMSAKERVELAAKELKATIENDQTLMNQFEKMAESKIDKQIFDTVIKRLFDVKDMNAKTNDVSTRKANQMTAFNNVLEKELTSHGETLWGLFNSVTYYENHVAVKEDRKLDHIFIGGGAKTMGLTFNDIMSYIESNERKLVTV